MQELQGMAHFTLPRTSPGTTDSSHYGRRLAQLRAVNSALRRQLARQEAENAAYRQAIARSELRAAANVMGAAPSEMSFVQRVHDVVAAHLDDEQFSVVRLARAMMLSREQLHRRLKRETGESPVALIRRHRLERAVTLLQDPVRTISEIAFAVGFSSVSYFSQCFKHRYGMPPSRWREHQARRTGQRAE